jgi:hypothetical protein
MTALPAASPKPGGSGPAPGDPEGSGSRCQNQPRLSRKEPTVASEVTGILDEAYQRLHATGPEFDGWLSNHGPMAAQVLECLLGQGNHGQASRQRDSRQPLRRTRCTRVAAEDEGLDA